MAGGHDNQDTLNLRRAFAGHVLYLALLTACTVLALRVYDDLGASWAWTAWLTGVFMFYLSLCCLYFPAPTTWIVLLMGWPQLPLALEGLPRVIVFAAVGGLATGMANLMEYHITSYLLRFRTIGRVRDTKAYHWAGRMFATWPFGLLVVISFVPIPVDVVRWIAIAGRYSRLRYFTAYTLGRFARYVMLIYIATKFQLSPLQIALIQGGLVLLAAIRVTIGALRRKKAV